MSVTSFGEFWSIVEHSGEPFTANLRHFHKQMKNHLRVLGCVISCMRSRYRVFVIGDMLLHSYAPQICKIYIKEVNISRSCIQLSYVFKGGFYTTRRRRKNVPTAADDQPPNACPTHVINLSQRVRGFSGKGKSQKIPSYSSSLYEVIANPFCFKISPLFFKISPQNFSTDFQNFSTNLVNRTPPTFVVTIHVLREV